MKNLKLKDGDILFDLAGKIRTVDGTEQILQSLNLKLRTVKGELFYNNEYGRPVIKGKQDESSILALLNETFKDDNRIQNIEIIKFKITKIGKLDVECLFYLNENNLLEYNFTL